MAIQNDPVDEIADVSSIEEDGLVFSLTAGEKTLYTLFTILLPILSFIIASSRLLDPEWQSGDLSDYAALMLTDEVTQYFFPFLIFSIMCMGLLIKSPEQYAEDFLVRFGIYTGVILSVHYSVILLLLPDKEIVQMSTFAWSVFLVVTGWLNPKRNQWVNKHRNWFFPFISVVWLIGFIVLVVSQNIYILILVALSLFAIGPMACLVISIRLSYRLMKKISKQKKSNAMLGGSSVVWGGAYVVTWQLAITQVLELYAELPKFRPPGCYIATAAAKGHAGFVGSKHIGNENGQGLWVNAQLRILKSAELALMTIAPRSHKICRQIYDVLGKRLADRITHPLLADLVYVSLKPFEWGSYWLLKLSVKNYDELAEKIYPLK